MAPKAVTSKIESCMLQLHAWKPFEPPFNPKKPCRSDRSTASLSNPNPSPSDLDLSRLSLLDDAGQRDGGGYSCTRRWFQRRKRRRRGSRSVSGRSSDWSGTHRRASAAYATCSDFPLAAGGTDSSGELFVHGGEGSWGSDASETRVSRREIEKESSSCCYGGFQGSEVVLLQGNESGYGSEPGYRGDGELGEEDGEFDEEDDDAKLIFWGDRFGGGGGMHL